MAELVVVPHADDDLETELRATLRQRMQRLLVGRLEHDRVRRRGGGFGLGAVGEKRQQCVGPHVRVGGADDDALGTALLGAPGTVGITDVHENGDAVALRNRLAQSPVGHGRGCYPAPGIA